MMLKPLLACFIAAAPLAAFAQSPDTGGWTVAGGEGGCIAHASSPQGTVMSILAGPGQDKLLFLVQNRSWSSLQDGGRHQLAVQLDGRGEREFEAVARTDLDSDGPGLLFAVAPGDSFLAEFAAASGMHLDQDGRDLDSLPLRNGGTVMTALAQCMSQMWSAATPDGEAPAPAAVAGTRI